MTNHKSNDDPIVARPKWRKMRADAYPVVTDVPNTSVDSAVWAESVFTERLHINLAEWESLISRAVTTIGWSWRNIEGGGQIKLKVGEIRTEQGETVLPITADWVGRVRQIDLASEEGGQHSERFPIVEHDLGEVINFRGRLWLNNQLEVSGYCINRHVLPLYRELVAVMGSYLQAAEVERGITSAPRTGPVDGEGANPEGGEPQTGPQLDRGGPGGRARYSLQEQDKIIEAWFRAKQNGGTSRADFIDSYSDLTESTLGRYITEYKKRHRQ